MSVRNVLLMLSTKQDPDPFEEVAWHELQAEQGDVTYLVTTCQLTGLVPEHSSVALYGDADLDNTYLGVGRFVEYVPRGHARWAELLLNSELYSNDGIPEGAQGFVGLRNVRRSGGHGSLDILGGIIESSGSANGMPLLVENIPQGASRRRVYFRTARPL